MKCGTSIGSNAEEAQDGQSKPDFIAKLSVSRKEARETIWWLRLALRVRVTTKDEISWELDEARQLRAMIISAIKTAQSRSSRARHP
jgi:four helix bundle protein